MEKLLFSAPATSHNFLELCEEAYLVNFEGAYLVDFEGAYLMEGFLNKI